MDAPTFKRFFVLTVDRFGLVRRANRVPRKHQLSETPCASVSTIAPMSVDISQIKKSSDNN
jgi:hypothetical protein